MQKRILKTSAILLIVFSGCLKVSAQIENLITESSLQDDSIHINISNTELIKLSIDYRVVGIVNADYNLLLPYIIQQDDIMGLEIIQQDDIMMSYIVQQDDIMMKEGSLEILGQSNLTLVIPAAFDIYEVILLELAESGVGFRSTDENTNPKTPEINFANNIGSNIKIFPNPTKDFVTISFITNEIRIGQIRIYDSLGGFVRYQNFEGSSSVGIDISGLSSGNYLVQIISNSQIFSHHLLVNK